MSHYTVSCAVICAVAGTVSANSAPVSVRDIGALIQQADVIAVGKILAVSDAGPAPAANGIAMRTMVGDVGVERTLKGPELTVIRFHFVRRAEYSGYPAFDTQKHRILFFARRGDHYEFVSADYHSIIAEPDVVVSGSDLLEQVAQIVSAVVASPRSSTQAKLEAVQTLFDIKHPAARSGLKVGMSDPDRNVRLTAAAGLLFANDISALPIAEAVLLRPDRDLSPDNELLHNLRAGVSRIKTEAAVPTLVRLQAASDTELRRAVASALQHIATAAAIGPLAIALDDADREVRYIAVIGLTRVAGQPGYVLSMEGFVQREQQLLTHWKQWAAMRVPK